MMIDAYDSMKTHKDLYEFSVSLKKTYLHIYAFIFSTILNVWALIFFEK